MSDRDRGAHKKFSAMTRLERLEYAIKYGIEHGYIASAADLNRKANLSQKYMSATLSKMRAGDPDRAIDFEVARQIADVVRVNLTWLYDGHGRPERSPYTGITATQRNVIKRLTLDEVPSELRREVLERILARFRELNREEGDAPHPLWEAEARDIVKQYTPR